VDKLFANNHCFANHHNNHPEKTWWSGWRIKPCRHEEAFNIRLEEIREQHHLLLEKKNKKLKQKPGRPFDRYKFPVLTSDHIPLSRRFDMNEKTNPFLLERININTVLNTEVIK
jgi:hypothetical protein